MRQVYFSNVVAAAMITAIRDACGLQPRIVLYGLGEGDSTPAGPEVAFGPGYGFVIAEAQYPDADWTGIGGPWLRTNDSGAWLLEAVAVGEVAYARIVDADTGDCRIQSDVAEGDPGADGPAIWIDERTVSVIGATIPVWGIAIEVLQSAHVMGP